MRLSVLFLLALSAFGVSAQNISTDFQHPTPISIQQECVYSQYSLAGGVSNELPVPDCERYYQNFNRYLLATVPESGAINIKAKFEGTADFGMAFYRMAEGAWTEIRCDFFRNGMGEINLYPTDEITNGEVLLRIWIVNSNGQESIEICASENQEFVSAPKLININTTTYTVSQLVTDVLVTGCLQAMNVTFQGGANSIGYFSNGTPGLDFAEGVIMSTGSVFDAPGPNSMGSTSTINNSGSDPQLQSLMPGYTINDATVLQFDFVPASNVLEFQYVFGSEEYPEFVNLGFNDVFAFFLSGPNPGGGNYNNVNIALIPSTSIPVTIDNVNISTNSQYYHDNTSGTQLEYDGYTVTLTATASVVQCATYHIKLAVGDCGDSSYDSAVFLKAGSFTSGESYTMQAYNAWGNALHFYEGCSNYLVFTRTDNTDINQPVPIQMTIGGTATPGTDYNAIPNNLTIPAGQQTYTYYIDAIIDNMAEGTETITFTFTNGCPCSTSTSTQTIYIDDQFGITPTMTNTGPVCVGDPVTFNLTLNQSGATSEVDIIWSTGHTDVTSVTISPMATSTVTATIIYPCDTVYATSTVTVINPPVPDIADDFEVTGFTAPLDANIAAGNTGVWSYVAGSGPGTVTIGAPTNAHTTATVNDFGTYTYLWTETSLAPNCVASDSVHITYFHIPTTDFYITPTLCYGDTAVVTYLGNGFNWATYDWDFDGGEIISGTGWGPYQVRWDIPGFHNVTLQITELNVVVDSTIQIYIPPVLSYVSEFADDPCFQSCNGWAQVTVSGGTPPYEYHWGSSTNMMNHLCAGQYVITVNDQNGCSFSHVFDITEPTQLVFDTAYQNVDCFGNQTAWAEATASDGTPPYSYFWSDGFVGQHHDNMAAGIYTVTISDSNGCTLFEQFSITQPALLQLAVSPSLAICENTSIIISAQAMGGTLPYVYQWSSGSGFLPGLSSFQITPHDSIGYQVYVTDAHNCQTPVRNIDIAVSPTMTHQLSLEHVKCNSECNGRSEITIQGGIPPYSYSWGSPNHILTDLCSGIYTLTVTDDIGCNFQTHFVITEPSALHAVISATEASCNGIADGIASVQVSGGTPPYSYLWPDNSTTNQMTNSAGTYTVTVTDAFNCRIERTVSITQPTPLVVQATPAPTICIGGTATVSAQSAGGTGYTSFNWNGSDGSSWNQHLFHVSPVETTTYSLTVTDENGCTGNSAVTVNVLPGLEISSITCNQDTLCVGDSTLIYVNSVGGNGGPYTLTLEDGQTVPSPFKVFPIETTTYYINLDDNCETPNVNDSITIYVMPTPENEFTIQPESGCSGVPLTFTESNEAGENTFFWNFGDGHFAEVQNPTHAFRDPGIYTVSLTVTSPFGCKNIVTQDAAVEVFINPTASFIATPEEASILHPLVSFTNYSTDASYYYWYYGDGDSTVYITNPQHYFDAPGEYQVKLIAKSINNCADMVYRTVMIAGEVTLYAPDAFTPNGDGINDCFRVCGNMIDPNSFIMKVYDRWGQLVFDTEAHVPDAACNSCVAGSWDGTRGSRIEGDKYLPMGMYFWYVEFRDVIGIKHEKSGIVRLLR